MDPEIPVLSVLDLGIVRDVRIGGVDVEHQVEVDITPTYSGCPAMDVIRREIESHLRASGLKVKVNTVFATPWTSDFITEEGREKLRKYGIAPPAERSEHGPPQSVPCPFCRSGETELRAEFGSTACKAFYFCNGCSQPFEHFKCV